MSLLDADVAMLILGLVLIAIAGTKLALLRPRHKSGMVSFDPGPMLAGRLFTDLAVWTMNGRGQQRKSLLTLHSIHGPNAANPRCMLGYCHTLQGRRVIRAEEVVALTNLETGESYADGRQALLDLVRRTAGPFRAGQVQVQSLARAG